MNVNFKQFKASAGFVFTYSGIALVVWQTNWIMGMGLFLSLWGFAIHNREDL